MARLNVNPTRMELQKLKQRLKTANSGHKLLKDKSDEMIRQFIIHIKENQTLRENLEEELMNALKAFMISRSKMTSQQMEEALSFPQTGYQFSADTATIMGLQVPSIQITKQKQTSALPYSLLSGSMMLDKSILTLSGLLEKIIRLAESEKICEMLASEIERNRRRINALEFILIPQIEETIQTIKMKLDENERNNLIRLIKVKEMHENAKEILQ